MKSIYKFTKWLIILLPAIAGAQETPALTVSYPTANAIVPSRTFNLSYVMTGDLVAARLDHVHWQLSGDPNLTAPNLSGAVEVTAPRDGSYTLTVYMATPEHVPINGKVIVPFKVVTNGISVLSPANDVPETSSDITVQYDIYGYDTVGATVRFQLDDGLVLKDETNDGQLNLQGVEDGIHTLKLWLEALDATPIGEVATLQFSVESTLSLENLNQAISLLSISQRTKDAKKQKSSLKRLLSLFDTMMAGGTQNPTISSLTQAAILQASKRAKKAAKAENPKKAYSQLSSYLKSLRQ